MESANAMKKKSSNFTKAEVEVLVNEVELNKETLFGKLSMQLTADTKKKCWEGITERINEVGAGEPRTEKSVRKKWSDLTSRTKKAEAERRREMFATGGGECSHTATSDTELKIIQVVGTEVIEGVLPGMDFGLLQAEQLLPLGNGENQVLLNALDPDGTQKLCLSVPSADASVPGQSVSVSTQTEIRERKRNLGGIDDVAEIEKRRLKVEGVLTIADLQYKLFY